MRIAIRAARDQNAQSRIMAAARVLGERFVLDLGERGILQRLQVQRGDVVTRAMLEREAIADLLDLVVEAIAPASAPEPEQAIAAVEEPATAPTRKPRGRKAK